MRHTNAATPAANLAHPLAIYRQREVSLSNFANLATGTHGIQIAVASFVTAFVRVIATKRAASVRRLLFTCGIFASLTYVATDIWASTHYAGYSFIDQAVSELFAIDAPTSRLVVPLFTLSSTLVAAFALGVWRSSGDCRAVRWLAVLFVANAANSLLLWNFFPMHMRGITPSVTDAMHGILAINPFVLLSVAFGIAAFRGWFRAYSAVTVLVLLVPAVLSFSNITAFVANQPTPGMGLCERVSQYGFQLWQAVLAVVLLREGRHVVLQPFGFKTPDGEAAFVAAYDASLKEWTVPYEERDIPTRFGKTHVIVSGGTEAPPLVLLHGYMGTSAMWTPNIADFTKDYRVYAIDVMGQASKSIPAERIRSAADYVAWLTMTLDALHLDRISLLGQSYGGWLALTYACAVPARTQHLVLLSPGGLQAMATQFSIRGMLMVFFPARFMVNSFMHWLGIRDTRFLDRVYLGLKHFRVPPETARVMPTVISDAQLRSLPMPTLVLYGDHEVICDPAAALARARRLIPHVDGALIADCSHDMCATQSRLVDARVLDFLKTSPTVAAKPAA